MHNAEQRRLRVRPLWLDDLATLHQGRIARQFVLHFNITDYIIDLSERSQVEGGHTRRGEVVTESNTPQTLRPYLDQFLFEALACQSIYTYSLANGLSWEDAPASAGLDRRFNEEPAEKTGLQLLHELGHQTHSANNQRTQATPQESELPTEIPAVFKLLSSILRQQYTPIAVVLDYTEKLIPYHLGEGQGDREQLQVLEVVQRWALDPQIRQSKN